MHHAPRSAPARTLRRAAAAVAVCLAFLAGLLTVAAPVHAAPAAPTNLLASSDVVPVLQWDPVPGAARYVVQVSQTSNFATSIVGPESTTNNRWVPTRLLPTGLLYWRVQAIDSSGAAGPWAARDAVIGATAAPTPVSPVGGKGVLPPTDPPVLTWTVVPGATGYEVEMDPDGDWIGSDTRTTRTNSLVWPEPQAVGDYFWRVRAQFDNNMVTAFSTAVVYNVLPLPSVTAESCPAGLACPPRANGLPHPVPQVEDVVLDWDPVLGARNYELRVGLDRDFNNIIDTPTVYGTRYSPPTTYANNGFFWQVRAVNAAGKSTEWPPTVNTFSRRWQQKPTLLHPSGTVGDDFYFQWTPVQHASHYELEVGTDPNFTENTYSVCRTDQTTYTAGYGGNDACMPSQGRTFFWRVIAVDNPAGVRSLYSNVGQFVYDTGLTQLVAPLNGAQVSVPTFRWLPTADTQSYYVEVRNSTGDVVRSETTYTTSYTPPNSLPEGNYRWTVVSLKANGGKSPQLSQGEPFTVIAPPAASGVPLAPLTARSSDPATDRFPELRWNAVDGAAYYRLRVQDPSGFLMNEGEAPALSARLSYPSVTDWSRRFLTPGNYVWRVEAFAPDNSSLGSGTTGVIKIKEPQAVGNRGIALDGQALDASARCTTSFSPSDPGSTCEDVPSTPVLDWSPVPWAGGYQVFLAEDPDLSTLVSVETTQNSRWTPTRAIADNESRPAYYWVIRPCKSITPLAGCAPDPRSVEDSATNAFRKLSPQVELSTPAAGASFANEVSFSWRDYRSTNADVTYAGGAHPSHQSAQRYRIQVSTTATFGSILETREVDQATYTSTATYPEGDLWWRVQAIDGSGNGLAWSETRRLRKATPVANLDPNLPNTTAAERPAGADVTSPSWNQHLTSGGKPFTWTAAHFDSTWNIEVYRNDDTTLSSTNRVLSLDTRQAAFTWSEFLPPASEPYRWRIRRTDVTGKDAQWSDFGRFYVDGVNPQLTVPAAGSVEQPNGPLFRWAAVPAAAGYRLEVRGTNNSTAFDTRTVTNVWATTGNLDTGSYQWRVLPLDANNQVMGSSEWRPFSVDAGLRATVPAQVQAPNGTGVGKALTSTPPSWNQPDVATEYQWLRNGGTIGGATGPTYVVTVEDYQQQITLRVRGTKPGFTASETVSNAITGSAGGAVVATSAPVLKGVPKVGEYLEVSPGTWSETSPRFTYEWLRNGVVIPDVTGDSYRLVAADAASTISVRVFADKQALTRGSATTNTVSVARLTSRTTTSLSAPTVRPGKKVTVTVRVEVPDDPRPTGTVKVYDGSRVVATVSLTARSSGVVTFAYKKVKKGKHAIKAVYSGSATTNGSTSAAAKLVAKK